MMKEDTASRVSSNRGVSWDGLHEGGLTSEANSHANLLDVFQDEAEVAGQLHKHFDH